MQFNPRVTDNMAFNALLASWVTALVAGSYLFQAVDNRNVYFLIPGLLAAGFTVVLIKIVLLATSFEASRQLIFITCWAGLTGIVAAAL